VLGDDGSGTNTDGTEPPVPIIVDATKPEIQACRHEDPEGEEKTEESTGDTWAWLGLGPAAVTVALIIGLLVDSGVFAEIVASDSIVKILWATARLFGFLMVAVAAFSVADRTRRRDKQPSNGWKKRMVTHPATVGTVVGLPFLLSTPEPPRVWWSPQIVTSFCWSGAV
jgi:hypothetical protein